MTTAAAVPPTYGEDLEGDEALETLRRTGRRRLVTDAFVRFRAADGFSHARALAFQGTLTLLPSLIALIGLAAAAEQEDVRRAVQGLIAAIAPGAAADLLGTALQQGSSVATQEAGETALAGGGLAAVLSGTSLMAQVERGANRIYGVERDRPTVRRYLTALVLALTAGVLALGSVVLLVGGSAIREAGDWEGALDVVWAVLRWPLGLVAAVTAVALLFEVAPHRRQPETSWLAFGAAAATALWLVFMAVLKVWFEAVETFGATYGPLAGTVGVLLWTFLSAVALLFGLALSAQLEAVRAGRPEPRVAREENR